MIPRVLRRPFSTVVRVAMPSLALACSGCAGSSGARVVEGAAYVGAAETAMRSDGIVFAPFELVTPANERAGDAFRCIDAVNRAAADALAVRYEVRAAPPGDLQRRGMPLWARGGGGRVAIHVEAVRCGLVVADSAYAMAASDDPGGEDAARGVVVLAVHDRMTGAVVIRIRGESKDSDAFAAARAAAERAAALLAPQ